MSDLETIGKKVAAIEVKVDTALELLREHRSNHFQFNLMAWGSVFVAISAVVVALIV